MEVPSDAYRLTPIRLSAEGKAYPMMDSGYATANSTVTNTPKDSEKNPGDIDLRDSAHLENLKSTLGGPIRFELAGHGIPKISAKFPDEITQQRFEYIMERIELPLHKYMQKSKLRRRPNLPMSIRLAMLEGLRGVEDARPGIVVLCRENLAKRVRRYFDKQEAKSLCRPADSKLPQFDVVVIGKAPQLTMAPIQIFSEISPQDSPRTTLCGTPIVVTSGIHTRIASMGGLIKLVSWDDQYVLYGMMAGHVAEQAKSESDTRTYMSNDGEDSDYFSSEDEQKRDSRAKVGNSQDPDPPQNSTVPKLDPSPALEPSNTRDNERIKLGEVAALAECQPLTKYFDWALVTIDTERIEPNIVCDMKQSHKRPSHGLGLPTKSLEYPSTRSVVIASGTNELRKGTLSTIPTKFLSATEQRFIDTYSLKLDDPAGIHEGDSGSWIVDEKTLDVYGHLIASDALGFGYVIPVLETFENIRQQLGAASVQLPTDIDIMCSRSMPRPPPRFSSLTLPFFTQPPSTPPPKDDLFEEDIFSIPLLLDSGYSTMWNTPAKGYRPLPSVKNSPRIPHSTLVTSESKRADVKSKDTPSEESSDGESAKEKKDVARLGKRKKRTGSRDTLTKEEDEKKMQQEDYSSNPAKRSHRTEEWPESGTSVIFYLG